MKASLPLATINELGQVTSPVWLLRQKGFDFGSVVSYPRADAIENDATNARNNYYPPHFIIFELINSQRRVIITPCSAPKIRRLGPLTERTLHASHARPANRTKDGARLQCV